MKEGNLESLVQELGIEEYIYFLDYVKDQFSLF